MQRKIPFLAKCHAIGRTQDILAGESRSMKTRFSPRDDDFTTDAADDYDGRA